MKAVRTNAIVTSIRIKQDKSLGMTVTTPELTTKEAVAFAELQGINLDMILSPLDHQAEEMVEVKTDPDLKSPSERLRGVIYAYWKENVNDGDFTTYYHKAMDRIIDRWKEKLDY